MEVGRRVMGVEVGIHICGGGFLGGVVVEGDWDMVVAADILWAWRVMK